MLDGWIIAGSIRLEDDPPASISARMSRSDSSTPTTYLLGTPHPSAGGSRMASMTVRRDRRLVHRGVGDPDSHPTQRTAGWLGRPGGGGAGHPGRRLRLRQPRDPGPQAAPDPRAAAGARARPRARPGHVVRRRQRHHATTRRHRRPRHGVRRSSGPARRFRCHRRALHRLRRGWRRSTGLARTVRALHRGRPRDRRAADDTLVDFWRMRGTATGAWDADRMHMGPAGHQHMAIAVLDALGVPHGLEELPPARTPS